MMDFIEKTGVADNEKAEAALIEQQRKDLLQEQERMRRWIEDNEPLPVKIACKLSQHIVAKSDADE
ncbi:MAG: hypothetical protein QME41_09175 [Actinomycetota bacterium]|nr:hypothetical protein [Actinomycetota bacterium]